MNENKSRIILGFGITNFPRMSTFKVPKFQTLQNVYKEGDHGRTVVISIQHLFNI